MAGGNWNKKLGLGGLDWKLIAIALVLGSIIDGIFVAKSEIDSWPLINKICA